MLVHRFVLILALALCAPGAQAFFDQPWITPAEPRAGDVVSVNIRGGICDSIFFKPGYPQITQQGDAIRILEYGHHWDTEDLCIYDIGTLAEPIGAFPPGDYTATVDFTYEDYPFGYTTLTLGVIPFTVTGATPPAPVPASSRSTQLVLLTLVSGSALEGLRRRRQTVAARAWRR